MTEREKETKAMIEVEGFPRRRRLECLTPLELKVREAHLAVEAGVAHPLMTEASVLIEQAREKIADFVDLNLEANCAG